MGVACSGLCIPGAILIKVFQAHGLPEVDLKGGKGE